jgi:hypothetical protein
MKRLLSLLAALILISSLLVSCGAAMKGDAENYAPAPGDKYYSSDSAYDTGLKSEITDKEIASGADSPVLADRKQIKNVLLRAQTKEYDSFINTINATVSHFGGYISNQRENGNSYNSVSNRYAYIVARIPAEKLDEFLSGISESCNVTYRNESIVDVTEAYVDVESRIAVLEAEESSLLSMLESAQNHLDSEKLNYSEVIDTMLYIKDRLLSVQSDLASYKAQLKTLSNNVAYSTVTLEINEVERFIAPEVKVGLWQEIGERLSDNLYYIGQDLRAFFVWFVTSLPYLLIWAAIITAAVIVASKSYKRVKSKKLGKKEDKEENKEENKTE